MSKVIMMCGVCGSGKTTYAKKKEQEGYIRLSIDEEMWKLYGRKGIDYPEEQYEKLSEQVEAALQKKLLSLIQQGKDVVIDFSFWSKENRNFYKKRILYSIQKKKVKQSGIRTLNFGIVQWGMNQMIFTEKLSVQK